MEYRKEDFARAVELWKDWNEKINVISRKDSENIFEHHILHSLAIARYIEEQLPQAAGNGVRILDVGTGGGFPGIPLAMVMPQVSFTLCDSIGKKIKVAQSVSQELGLSNVRCVNCRAEELHEKFDYVVSRAVTTLANFYPWVKDSFTGSILYLKGGDINSEIEELERKCKVPGANLNTWSISDWLIDDYFKEKFVIEIRKNYLCTPKVK